MRVDNIQCDKCGALVPEAVSGEWAYIYKYPDGYKDGTKVDFCPDCYSMLLAFISTKP
jgi:hypothetical protein